MNFIDDSLCYLTVAELKRLYRSREISPVEVLQAQIQRAEKCEPVINAFCGTYFSEAMEAAKRAEKCYADRKAELRPLEGITVSVKDVLDHKGKINSMGSLIFKDRNAEENHPVVERILDAGGIIHARTTTSEFAYGWITTSRLWGTTRNPWDPALTPGGSSGGAAASLACGTSTLAIGADSAGSIRVPASMCGVVGYKPPYGRVPDTMYGYDSYSVIGPMGRTVQDCAVLQNVISGVHPGDIATLRDKIELRESPIERPDIPQLRLAYSFSTGNAAISEMCAAPLRESMRNLRQLGATVDEVDIGWTTDVIEAGKLHGALMFQAFFEDILKHHADELCEYSLHTARSIDRCDARKFVWTYSQAQRMYESLAPVLETYDALIFPTTVTNQIGAEQMPWQTSEIDGITIDSDYDWVATVPFNILGQLPVLAIPAGLATNGVPVGMQVICRSFDDQRAFRVAELIESVSASKSLSATWPNLAAPD